MKAQALFIEDRENGVITGSIKGLSGVIVEKETREEVKNELKKAFEEALQKGYLGSMIGESPVREGDFGQFNIWKEWIDI